MVGTILLTVQDILLRSLFVEEKLNFMPKRPSFLENWVGSQEKNTAACTIYI